MGDLRPATRLTDAGVGRAGAQWAAVTAILVYGVISLMGTATLWALLYRYVYQRRRTSES